MIRTHSKALVRIDSGPSAVLNPHSPRDYVSLMRLVPPLTSGLHRTRAVCFVFCPRLWCGQELSRAYLQMRYLCIPNYDKVDQVVLFSVFGLFLAIQVWQHWVRERMLSSKPGRIRWSLLRFHTKFGTDCEVGLKKAEIQWWSNTKVVMPLVILHFDHQRWNRIRNNSLWKRAVGFLRSQPPRTPTQYRATMQLKQLLLSPL